MRAAPAFALVVVTRKLSAVAASALLAQRGALFGWVPVCLAIGIGAYFTAATEPGEQALRLLAGLGGVALLLWRVAPGAVAPLFLGVALIAAGFGLAHNRALTQTAPVLGFRYYGPVQGRIVGMDRAASDAVRLTLDQVVLARMAPDRTPAKVRVALHGRGEDAAFRPGDTVMLTGHLSPPAGPAEPGGFNFQRHAWFLGIGAVGYTRNPVVRLAAAAPGGWRLRIFALRMQLSAAIQEAVPGPPGAFAAAIMTGDRAGMDQRLLAHLRAANLAHLLAISGLHMGLLTGFVFASLRYGLAAIPGAALHLPIKKIAAICALLAGAFYLALSGGNVATERAFIMVAVIFVAVLADRRALTLRAVAIAATLILLWQPEALLGPGFQMSFAATTALVAVFGALRRVDLPRLPGWGRAVLSVFLSSLVAGLATAPFAAAHFNVFAHYGLIANLLSVPLMGVLVMPAAVLALCLAPLGLWEAGLWVASRGLRWILWVAETVASRPEAVSHMVSPPAEVLPLIALGGLCVILVQGRLRFAGVLAGAAALALWGQSPRPALLVADTGGLMGVMTAQGRALSHPSGHKFVAGVWLENDGDGAPQAVAGARPGLWRAGRVVTVQLGAWQITQIRGKTALASVVGCAGSDILISDQPDIGPRPCLSFDASALRRTGALRFDLMSDGALRPLSARAAAGERLWTRQQRALTLPARLTKGAEGEGPRLVADSLPPDNR